MATYGYARVSKEDVARWTELVFAYLRGRPNLRRVFLLIDSRRGPLDNDIAVMQLLDRAGQLRSAEPSKDQELDLVFDQWERHCQSRARHCPR